MENCYNSVICEPISKIETLTIISNQLEDFYTYFVVNLQIFEFCKKMLSETCTSQDLSRVKKEKCHKSVIYEPISKL